MERDSRLAGALRTLTAGVSTRSPAVDGQGSPLLRSTLLFAVARSLVICLAALTLYLHERNALVNENERDAAALSLVFEQNVSNISQAIDDIIKSTRRSAMGQGSSVDWPALLREGYSVEGATASLRLTKGS